MDATSGSMATLLQNLTKSHYRGYTSDELLSLATACVGRVGHPLFDSFFMHVRRVTVREL